MDKFKELLNLVELNKNNPVALSELAIQLVSYLYTHNEAEAQAQLREDQAITDLLFSEDKISVAAAEAKSHVLTNNEYKKYKLQRETIMEAINTIKKRVDVLGWEIKHQ